MSPSSSESPLRRARRRLSWLVRDRWPDRAVTRTVQGVELLLPWSHRLPDYVEVFGEYGQNLVRLAEALSTGAAPLTVLDVGANVGDSARQIIAATDAQVVCVEADAYFLRYLRANAKAHPRIRIEGSLLVEPEHNAVDMAPVRRGGTTRFAEGVSSHTQPSVSAEQLRANYPELANLRLAKSDTDGYDVRLIPMIARTWSDLRPVLFFEYDHRLTRLAGNDPLAVWSDLQELGYAEVAVWDNVGEPLGRAPIAALPALAARLDESHPEFEHPYWDVAVIHCADDEAAAVLRSLVPGELSAN